MKVGEIYNEREEECAVARREGYCEAIHDIIEYAEKHKIETASGLDVVELYALLHFAKNVNYTGE